jgi:NTE family protein
MDHKPKLGLALSGGGARGLAHIGVLKALESSNIQVDFLAGTSMGGVIAAAYAAGLSPEEIEEIALNFRNSREMLKLADPGIPGAGIFRGEQLLKFFKSHY